MFAYSNFLALLGAAYTFVVYARWIRPSIGKQMRRYFISLLIWTPVYIVGQITQAAVIGPIWIQDHLLDLAYGPWCTAVLAALWTTQRKLRHKGFDAYSLDVRMPQMLLCINGFGILSEMWDTYQMYLAGFSLTASVDWGDYACLSTGSLVAIVPFLATKKVTLPTHLQGAVQQFS